MKKIIYLFFFFFLGISSSFACSFPGETIVHTDDNYIMTSDNVNGYLLYFHTYNSSTCELISDFNSQIDAPFGVYPFVKNYKILSDYYDFFGFYTSYTTVGFLVRTDNGEFTAYNYPYINSIGDYPGYFYDIENQRIAMQFGGYSYPLNSYGILYEYYNPSTTWTNLTNNVPVDLSSGGSTENMTCETKNVLTHSFASGLPYSPGSWSNQNAFEYLYTKSGSYIDTKYEEGFYFGSTYLVQNFSSIDDFETVDYKFNNYGSLDHTLTGFIDSKVSWLPFDDESTITIDLRFDLTDHSYFQLFGSGDIEDIKASLYDRDGTFIRDIEYGKRYVDLIPDIYVIKFSKQFNNHLLFWLDYGMDYIEYVEKDICTLGIDIYVDGNIYTGSLDDLSDPDNENISSSEGVEFDGFGGGSFGGGGASSTWTGSDGSSNVGFSGVVSMKSGLEIQEFDKTVSFNSGTKECDMFDVNSNFLYNGKYTFPDITTKFDFLDDLPVGFSVITKALKYIIETSLNLTFSFLNSVLGVIYSSVYVFPEDSVICFLGHVYTVKYQSIIPSDNQDIIYAKGLEDYKITKGSMTFIDYFVLLIFGGTNVGFLFYYFKPKH